MVKLNIEDVVMMHENINFLLELNLPIKKSYKIGNLINIIRDKFFDFDQKRQDLVRKYGEVNKDKGEVRVASENMEIFTNELKGLLFVDFAIDFDPISIDDLGDVKVSTKQMAIFAKLFTEKQSNACDQNSIV
jgi:hypothetical protein